MYRPVHLPVELLSNIFLLATHDQDVDGSWHDNAPSFNSESVQAPLAYGAVCRYWRAVALSTPALYTSICITPELIDADQQLNLRGIIAYLKLSRKYALDILIDARDQDWDFDDEGLYQPWFTSQHMSEAMALLVPHLARWRSISIYTDVRTPMNTALQAVEAEITKGTNAARLETFRIMRCDAYAAFGEADTAYSFLSSLPDGHSAPVFPQLRHMVLRGIPAAWAQLRYLPASLRSLELSFLPALAHPSMPDLEAMLLAAPKLQTLTLNGAGPTLPSAPSSNPDIAPNLSALESLSFGYTCTTAGAALLQFISSAAPGLQTLSLEDASDPASLVALDAAAMLSFVFSPAPGRKERSFSRLRTLSLRRVCASSTPQPPAQSEPQSPVFLDRLDLHAPSETLYDLAKFARCVCARGAFLPPFSARFRDYDSGHGGEWVEHATLRLTENTNTASSPEFVEVHEELYPQGHHESEAAEQWITGDTKVRVVRKVREADEYDEDSDEDSECGDAGSTGSAESESDAFDWMPVPVRAPRDGHSARSLVTMLTLPGLAGNLVVRVRG